MWLVVGVVVTSAAHMVDGYEHLVGVHVVPNVYAMHGYPC